MRLEFLGVSGVGKTYVATHYSRQLQDNGDNVSWFWKERFADKGWVRRNIDKFFAVTKTAFLSPKWSWELYSYLKSKELKDNVGKMRLLFNGFFLKYAINLMKDYQGIALFDEGVAQYILAVHLRSPQHPSHEEIHRVMRLLGYPLKIIVVDASTQTIAYRLNSRGRRAEILKASDQMAEIERMKTILETTVSALSEIPNIQIERINNHENSVQ